MKCFLWLKHKVRYKNGKGYICIRCGKTALECQKDERRKADA